ncbi:MAG: DNA-binding protein WhiA [Tissierellia bacterium]|nr:DNA-binding protein WhiA [Tissierellia bacterium]
MSFSSRVKNEVARWKVNDFSLIIAELAGFVRMCGRIQIRSNNELSFSFFTENAAIARRIFTFIKNYYTENVTVSVSKNTTLKRNNLYRIEIPESSPVKVLLDDVRFVRDENVFIPVYPLDRSLISSLEERKAYIRGSFLGSGSISNPEKSYHLEFNTEYEDHAKDLSEIINSFGLQSKVSFRKEKYIVYLKEGEQISDMLSLIGSYQGVLKFEDIRIFKDMRNHVNRQVNCETANLSKTVNASMRQAANIKFIEEYMGLEELPTSLYEVAILRLEHPDASLKEIGELLDPPLGKSGINHRLKKIEEIAIQLRGE